MPVRMVATRRRVYDPSTNKEYAQGETFITHDHRVATKLERSRKATRLPDEGKEERFPAVQHQPRLRTRALTADDAPAPAPVPVPEVEPASVAPSPAEDTSSPFAETPAAPDAEAPSPRRYTRRDLRAEES